MQHIDFADDQAPRTAHAKNAIGLHGHRWLASPRDPTTVARNQLWSSKSDTR